MKKEDVTDDLEIKSGKPGATSTSNQTLPTFKPQPSDSSVNQTHHIMFKEAMVRGLNSTVAQQLVDIAKSTIVFNKEDRDLTTSHHMWTP